MGAKMSPMEDDLTRLGDDPLAAAVGGYRPDGSSEEADLDRITRLMRTADDPWDRAKPLHVTGSALVVHPASNRVLLRWHQRQQAWLQVGGHGDPGERDPLAVALREAEEETGLADLRPWPTPDLRHVAIVGVPAGKGEPAHEHADLRYVLATAMPDAIVAESEHAQLRWLPVADAVLATTEANLRETLSRVRRLLDDSQSAPG
jgi:8-oxo-dGTP pyrophosphatase MutT (NUDIX family)